ncbi:MAG: hypothetical protein KAT16_07980, partial [Candidatus Heimdallarchaeota archaeon]|nr:hypothetical protein [Candidatus Heimdallarchaeota archaeon]
IPIPTESRSMKVNTRIGTNLKKSIRVGFSNFALSLKHIFILNQLFLLVVLRVASNRNTDKAIRNYVKKKKA